ncbi:hypothetical protein NC653_034080 [Populus alba x Populus x berolinensis]|uniref:Uncharacterized protein n=1 Tax=Populus alba x Populus x berolinensis TaxID=444605 RepID=A0AAD6PVT9_9ROSI|nr:hypothetical protein NC653_034080 [Populus alba x Populus x berolinensis]
MYLEWLKDIQVHADEGGTLKTRRCHEQPCFQVYDIYDDLISRRVHSSDAREICRKHVHVHCNGAG